MFTTKSKNAPPTKCNDYTWLLGTKIRPHRRCKGRDHPDGISQLRFRFTWRGGIFWKKPPVFDRSWRSPSQNTVKNSTERTCSLPRPPNLRQEKVKILLFFNFLDSFFGFATCFFCRWCGVARKRFFVILDPFLDSFSDFFQARNTGFYGIFVFCRSLTAIFKNAKTIVNTSVLCRPVAKNLANTTVFGRWV